jgi:uncharacterized OB-fold protein
MATYPQPGYRGPGGSEPADHEAPTAPHPVTPTPTFPPPTLAHSGSAMSLAAAAGERCTNCGTALASDQRYCVNCGERRGQARFDTASVEAGRTAAATTATVAAVEPYSRPPRFSSGATLITGVATLLVAMGLGFLIGHDSASTTKQAPVAAAPQPVHVVINGGGGSGGGGSSNSTSTKSGKHGKHGKATSTSTAHVSKKTAAKANAAASKVLGGASQKVAPPTVQQGGSCSGGAGCQGGKFTGNFFGQ